MMLLEDTTSQHGDYLDHRRAGGDPCLFVFLANVPMQGDDQIILKAHGALRGASAALAAHSAHSASLVAAPVVAAAALERKRACPQIDAKPLTSVPTPFAIACLC